MVEGGREVVVVIVSEEGVGSAGVEAGASVAWVSVAVAVISSADAVLESFMVGGWGVCL